MEKRIAILLVLLCTHSHISSGDEEYVETDRKPEIVPVCTNGIQVVCRYALTQLDFNSHESTQNLYTCTGEKIACINDSNETNIWGYHFFPTHSDLDVEAFRLDKAKLIQFPKNVERFFPNLKVITVNTNLISQISNDDLIPHQNLVFISISYNIITDLPSNLFDGMPNLKNVLFDSNKIMHVGHNIKLPSAFVSFKQNTCIKSSATYPDKIADLEFELLRKCPPVISQIETILERRDNLLTRLKDQSLQSENKIISMEIINERLREVFDDTSSTVTTITATSTDLDA